MCVRDVRPMTAHDPPRDIPPSVSQRALGERFGQLDPALQRYFGSIPPGMAGSGAGVYEFAGSRRAWLRPVLTWMAWRRILFPESGRNVPFTVWNTATAEGGLRATRTFDFPRRTRVMEDSMVVIDGRLVDRLGRRGGLEVALEVGVHDGGMQMTSGRLHLRLRSIRIPLPRVATLTLDERTHPAEAGRQLVDVRITSRWVGEVFRYHGSFAYELIPLPAGASSVSPSAAAARVPARRRRRG